MNERRSNAEDMTVSRDRIRGVGIIARGFSVPLGILLSFIFISWLFPSDRHPYGDPLSLPNLTLAIVLTAIPAGAAARSLMIGVHRRGSSITVRSWFRTWRISDDEGATCRPVGYSGMVMGTGGTSGFWSMLEFSRPGMTPWAARGSIARHAISARQAAEINVWLNAPVDAAPRDRPRHIREAPSNPD